jgi:hypothetical protein
MVPSKPLQKKPYRQIIRCYPRLMFGSRRKVTLENFAQECVHFSLLNLTMSAENEVKIWNAAIEYGANPQTSVYELLFLSCVSTWHALFAAKARRKITSLQWEFLNERFLTSVMERLSTQIVRESPWGVPLSEILQARLEEYRNATAGVPAIVGLDAMCRVFAKVCSGDPSNQRLFMEAKGILGIGTNKLVEVISSVKFID